MQIDCPRCRRVLEYSGDRPSFCAYCGVPLAEERRSAGSPPSTLASETTQEEIGPDPDPDRTAALPFPGLLETIQYVPTHSTTALADEVAERVAGFRLIRKLGAGGMGTVFEAEDELQGQRVAIKLISREHVTSEEAVERFRQEGRLASAVTHPRCVFVLAVDEFHGRPYIVMELMPGTTLQTLVENQGPLPPAMAINKIFDVIEGLQEFHKLGLIHRDVKPSNCFLEKDGRVKIGDFGLSKALAGGIDLTQTGTFLGTPLYASPEQIKRDEVDERTDVYSVAATLYYLLCGRPPVQAKDAAEALARIASEPAPPLRADRPDLPRALESIILRGLERDPARRWRSLQEFHDALAPFVPERLSIAGIGLRVGAYVIDVCLAYLVSWAIFGLVILYYDLHLMDTLHFYEHYNSVLGWVERTLWFSYFALLESMVGASLGKWVVGLRVTRTDRGGPPGIGRGLPRALVFYALTELPADLMDEFAPLPQGPRMLLRLWIYERVIRGLGILALISTMRQKTGFRGPHEWLSRTRVVQVIGRRRFRPTRRLMRMADSGIASDPETPAPEKLKRIGPYLVRGAVRWEADRKVLVGQDSTLERPVWIVLRNPPAPPPSQARRSLNRRTRPRWIGGGDEPEGRWDAFTAPVGVPLYELVTPDGLPWRDALPLLRELTEELQTAIAEGTLPCRLSPEQVWVQTEGNVQLVDGLEAEGLHSAAEGTPDSAAVAPTVPPAASVSNSSMSDRDERRALDFLGATARLALEGRRSPGSRAILDRATKLVSAIRAPDSPAPLTSPGEQTYRIRAAVPEHAATILERLVGFGSPYSSLAALHRDLEISANRPAEVNLVRRGIHLAVQGFLLLPGLALMLLLATGIIPPRVYPWDLETVGAVPLCWILWAMLTQGGLSFPLTGIVIVRNDGRRASSLACGLRALLAWAPFTLLLLASRYLQETSPTSVGLYLGLLIAASVVLVLNVALSLLFPARCLHDRIARTVLVPA
jgi:uncharacterized RDD family membrane protein YckC